MRRLSALVLLGTATACLDFSTAHDNCVRNGRCGATGTGGGSAGGLSTAGGGEAGGAVAGGSSGGEAGGLAGGGTAGGAIVPYDGGPSCSGLRPRLRCDGPTVLSDGGLYKTPVLGFIDGGVVYGWANGLRFEMFRATSAGTTKVVDEVAASGVQRAELAAAGDYWAAIYHSGENNPIRCFSSHGVTAVTSSTAGYYGGAGVAVSPRGEVAVVKGYDIGNINYIGWKASDAGCPASLVTLRADVYSDYMGAVWSPIYGFRFTSSGLANTYNGGTGINGGLDDGGLQATESPQNVEGVMDHTAILSSLATHAIMAVSTVHTDGVRDFYVLKARSLPLDLSMPLGQQFSFPITDDYLYWHSTTCGSGCMATVFTHELGPRDVTVKFTNDSPVVSGISASDAGWDVACNTSGTSTEVKSAYAGGRLHFIVTDPGVARLFSCDVPP